MSNAAMSKTKDQTSIGSIAGRQPHTGCVGVGPLAAIVAAVVLVVLIVPAQQRLREAANHESAGSDLNRLRVGMDSYAVDLDIIRAGWLSLPVVVLMCLFSYKWRMIVLQIMDMFTM